MKTIAVIPSRAGSRGVPGKGWKVLGGRPLIQWTIDAAVPVFGKDSVFVTSDSPEVIEIASCLCSSVSRPSILATDDCQTDELYRYTLRQIQEMIGKFNSNDIVAFLDPTCPFRDKDDIIRAVATYERYRKYNRANPTVFCVVQDRKFHWKRTFQETDFSEVVFHPTEHDPSTRVGRQSVSSWLYRESGAAYIIDPVQFLEKGNYRQPPFVGCYLDETHAVEIDEPLDWLIAETILAKKDELG